MMEVTASSLAHPKKIHRLLLHDQHALTKLSLVLVGGSGGVAGRAESLWTGGFLASFETVQARVSFDFLLHPALLEIALEHCCTRVLRAPHRVVYVCGGTDSDRLRLSLPPQQTVLELDVSKELYEKLGLEGERRAPPAEGRRLIRVDLRDGRLAVGHRHRARLLANAQLTLRGHLHVTFTCASVALPALTALLRSCHVPWTQLCPTSTTSQHSLPAPAFDYRDGCVPDAALLEDWGLWLGAITAQTALLLAGSRLDPFVSTCRLPDECVAGHAPVTHFSVASPAPLAPLHIVDLLEGAAALYHNHDKEHTRLHHVCLSGHTANGQGFAMFIDAAHNFVFCNAR